MSTKSSDTSADTGSIETAAAVFGRLMDPEGAPVGRREPRKREDAEADEAEAQQADAEEDETPEDVDADDTAEDGDEGDDDAEGSEDEADAQDDEAEGSSVDPDTLVTVKVDGKEERVKLGEALAGYQRQADYSRKTAGLADDRRSFESERAAVRQERAQYAQLLGALDQQLSAVKAPDWEKLKAEDPVEYAIKRLEWQETQEKRAAVQAEQGRLAQAEQEEQAKAFNETVQVERQKMLDAVPAWKDEAIWKRDREALRAYGAKIGFSPEELAAASDHRAIVALYKAMKFDRLMAKQGKAKPSPAPAPTPLRAGSSNKPPARERTKSEAMQRLRKSGSVQDAAAFFETIL